MAKKKISEQENQNPQSPHVVTTEQLANLKVLNNLLVREVVERREQMDTLLQSKEALESELAEQKSIRQDEMAAYEVEREVSILAIASQFAEQEEIWKEEILTTKKMAETEAERKLAITQKMQSMEKEREEAVAQLAGSVAKIEECIREKGEIEGARAKLEIKIQELRNEMVRLQEDVYWSRHEGGRLILMVVELERSNALVRAESGRIRMERDGLVEEKMVIHRQFESFMEEKESMQQHLKALVREIEDLNSEIQDKVLAMDAMERERAKQDLEISNLQGEVDRLGVELRQGRDALGRALHHRDVAQTELDQQKEEVEVLVLKINDLEKTSATIQEKLGQLQMEKDGLLKDREEKERSLELLKIEQGSTDRSLMELSQLIEDLKRQIEEIVKEKGRMEKEIANLEVKTAQLEEEAANANATRSMLQESCGDLTEKNCQLGNDLNHQKDEIERVLCEKEGIRKDLDRVKHEGEALEIQVLELRKSKEETLEELQHIRAEHEGLLKEKKEWIQQLEVLTEDRNSMEQRLVEAQQGIANLQARIKSSEMLSKQALSMLKRTAEMVCESEERGKELKRSLNVEEMVENIQLFEVELEAIKGAFGSRAKKVEDMTKEIESLQISVTRSQKNSIWAWVSSAATIVGAASIAYITRGR